MTLCSKLSQLCPRAVALLIILGLFLVQGWGCRTLEEIRPEDVEFAEKAQARYFSLQDKRNQEFWEFVQVLEARHESFSANFSMRIDRVSPHKESFHADGRIWFLKDTGQIKIQLMDNFFGMIFSEVIASPGEIQVKSSQDQKIHIQPMGDLGLYDPGKKKMITIPFPVIYYSITGGFGDLFEKNRAVLNPDERRAMVRSQGDEFEFVFDDQRLLSLQWNAPSKNMKAVARAGTKPNIPSEHLTTKVMEMGSDRETVVIQTKLRSIQKKKPPVGLFRF